MAMQTGGLSRGRVAISAELAMLAVLVAFAIAATLVYLRQPAETPIPQSVPRTGELAVPGAIELSTHALENSRAFVREQGGVQLQAARPVFGSGAYVRELIQPLGFAGFGNSLAHVREAGATATSQWTGGTWAYAREAGAPSTHAVTGDGIVKAATHAREAPN